MYAYWEKLTKGVYLDMDFRHNEEFIKKYTAISLQQGKLYIWITFIIGWYSLYLDMILKKLFLKKFGGNNNFSVFSNPPLNRFTRIFLNCVVS